MKIYLYVLFILSCTTQTLASIPEPVKSFASLPIHFREARFKEIQEAFEQRSTLFLKGRQFHAWQDNKTEKDISIEFEHLNEWRFNTWFVDPSATSLVAREDFMVAQDLLEKGYFRQPQTIAFTYNQTDASYNSSTIILNGMKFLAMEGPSNKTLNNFIKLLINHQVNQLVRLSPAQEHGTNEIPYWNGKIRKMSKNNEFNLNLPQGPLNLKPYPLLYYFTEDWAENKDLSPKHLLNLVLKVKKSFDPSNGLLACHCTNGDGRTGTFLAAFVLITEIDKQMATAGKTKKTFDVSIEKIVMQLSLQRPYMVVTKGQYNLLYQMVNLYAKSLMFNPTQRLQST